MLLDGILLKPNMILPGLDAPVATPKEVRPRTGVGAGTAPGRDTGRQGHHCVERCAGPQVAHYTVRTLKRTIPPAVPGIHFLR